MCGEVTLWFSIKKKKRSRPWIQYLWRNCLHTANVNICVKHQTLAQTANEYFNSPPWNWLIFDTFDSWSVALCFSYRNEIGYIPSTSLPMVEKIAYVYRIEFRPTDMTSINTQRAKNCLHSSPPRSKGARGRGKGAHLWVVGHADTFYCYRMLICDGFRAVCRYCEYYGTREFM